MISKFTILLVIISCFFGIAVAKDLYVSTTGDDSISYTANDVNHPWRTVAHAWGNVQTNDVVYYRGGTYPISATINYWNQSQYVTHKNYQNETVLWDSDIVSDSTFNIRTNHLTIDGIDGDQAEFRGGSGDGFFKVGEGGSATHFTLRNAEGLFSGDTGDNAGYIFAANNADHLLVENCKIRGTIKESPRSPGVACVWIDRSKHSIFRNNEFGNIENGIYFKHSNQRTPGAGPLVENNYFYDCDTAGIHMTQNYGIIRNNLFVSADLDTGFDGGTGDGGTGSDFNEYYHNTFYQGSDHSQWSSACPSGAGDPGATDNTLNNNAWINGALMGPEHEAHNCTESMRLKSDYNLYSSYRYRRDNKNMSEIRTLWSGDTHSLFGVAIIVGGATPTTIDDYALTPASPGYQAASDGTNMGANMSAVGLRTIMTPMVCSNHNGNQTSCESNGCNYCVGTCQNASCPTSTDIRADVDQNASINTADAMLTLRNSLGLIMTGTVWQTSATTGDVNCDGKSNTTDAMLILRQSSGLSMNGTGWCE